MTNRPFLAVATRCFNQGRASLLKQSIRIASLLNLSAIQLDVRTELKPETLSETGRRQFLKLLKENGLSVASVVLPTKKPLADPEYLDARLHALRNAIQFAAQLKCQRFPIRVGALPESGSADEKVLLEILNDLTQQGDHFGVTLCLTPVADSPERILDLCENVRAGYLGIDLDFATLYLNQQPIAATMRSLYSRIKHITVRDAHRDSSGMGHETCIGEGGIDWLEVFAVLSEIEYHGALTIVRNEGNQQQRDIELSISRLHSLLTPTL